jgi:cysteine desulfurase
MDYNATTPVDPEAFEAMRPFFCETFGNPSSNTHSFGHTARRAVDRAATQVASLIGCKPREIVWTSGTTESNNLAIKGVAQVYRERGRHIITQTTEHKSVLDPLKKLAAAGYEVTWLSVDRGGRIDLDELRGAIRPDTILVSIMIANNETGVIQPIREIGAICRERGVLFHTDATQAVAKIPVDVDADHIDLLAMTAHKLYGPKGVGALYVRCENPCVKLIAQLDGGGHQNGLRSGTLNAAGIVGLGAACEIAQRIMGREAIRLAALRDKLERGLQTALGAGAVHVNGDRAHRLPHVSSLALANVDGEDLLVAMDDIAVSSGSACTSANPEPSFVLRAMGVPRDLALASIRFSLGRGTSEADVDYAVEKVARSVRALRVRSGDGVQPAIVTK